jgi:hypothetical protein
MTKLDKIAAAASIAPAVAAEPSEFFHFVTGFIRSQDKAYRRMDEIVRAELGARRLEAKGSAESLARVGGSFPKVREAGQPALADMCQSFLDDAKAALDAANVTDKTRRAGVINPLRQMIPRAIYRVAGIDPAMYRGAKPEAATSGGPISGAASEAASEPSEADAPEGAARVAEKIDAAMLALLKRLVEKSPAVTAGEQRDKQIAVGYLNDRLRHAA